MSIEGPKPEVPKQPVVPKAPEAPKPETSEKGPQAGGQKEKGIPKRKEVVLFGGSENSKDKGKQESGLRKVLTDALNEIASEKFGKSSYRELDINQKLTALETHLKNLEEVSESTRVAVERLKSILEKEPEPTQLDEMKKVFAELPVSEDFEGLEAEVQRKLKENIAGHVIKHRDDFKLDEAGISQFTLAIGETSIGATPMPPFGFDEVAKGVSDPPLKQLLNNEQAGFEMRGFDPDSKDDVEAQIGLLDSVRNDIIKGSRPDRGDFDPKEAKIAVDKINTRIAELRQGMNKMEREARRERTFAEIVPKDVAHMVDIIRSQRSLRYVNAEDVIAMYENIPGADRELIREEFTKHIRGEIRKRISSLNKKAHPWHLGGSIDEDIQDLEKWLKILGGVDHEQWEIMQTETEGRAWLFHMYDTLSKGASPMDTKDLARPMQEFDKAEYWSSIAQLPGVAKATQLLEAYYDEILASESNPSVQKKVFDRIIHEVGNDPVFKLSADGMDAESAVETAYHFYHARLRDAQRYQMYMEKNNCIKITHENGTVKYVVDPNAPQLWNSFRLAIYPDSMWTFFQFGSNAEGVEKPMLYQVRNSAGEYVTKSMGAAHMGQGVGAEVYEKLKEYKFSTNFTDFDSRRLNGYLIPAWTRERMQHEKDLLSEHAQIAPDKMEEWLEKHKDYTEENAARWQREHAEFESGGDSAALYNAKKALEFCVTQGIPLPQGRIDEIRKSKNTPGFAALLSQAESYENEMRGRFGVDYRQKYRNGSCEVIPDMSKYDVSKVPYEWMLRKQESVRGNYRDTFSALGVADVVGKFIVDPTLPNFEKFDWHMMVGYATPQDAMLHFVLPGYLALSDMNRGQGPLGGEMIFRLGKSRLGKIRGVPAMDDKQLYEVGRWAVAQGGLSNDMLYNARGKLAGFAKDTYLLYNDPVRNLILFLAIIAELKNQIEKDSKGS
jgi:hypothetical protein